MMSSSFFHFSKCFPCSCFSMCMRSYSTFCSILSALNGHSVSFSRRLFIIDSWCWISMLCSSLYNYYIFLSIFFWVVNSPGRMPYVEQDFSLTVSQRLTFLSRLLGGYFGYACSQLRLFCLPLSGLGLCFNCLSLSYLLLNCLMFKSFIF